MTIYTCNQFTGHYPVGAAAIVSANTPKEAADLLNVALIKQGLPGDAEATDMIPFPDHHTEVVRVLVDGSY